MPKNATVAISTLGCMKDKRAKEMFFEGWRKAYQAILPSLVLCYGTIPERFNEKVIKMGEYKHQKYIS